MYFIPAKALLPMPIQMALRNEEKVYHAKVENIINNRDKVILAESIRKEFKHIVKRPDGRIGYEVILTTSGTPILTIYCCVASFSDASILLERLNSKGYEIVPKDTTDNKYNMSRQFYLKKVIKKPYTYDTIYLQLFAQKKLGSTCRAVSMGYQTYSNAPVEQFKLVCDEFEEIAIKRDIDYD